MAKKFFIPTAPSPVAPVFGADKPWLAPLAGYSDLPFRMLCREYGAAVCETEMISAKGLVYENTRTSWLLASLPEDQPLIVQIFGAEEESLVTAARSLRDAGYLWLDLNLGCSVRKVMRQGAGAALLADPEKTVRIARALIKAVKEPGAQPPGMIGFKLRLGVDGGHKVLPDLAFRLAELGADWISLHPRFANENFEGRSRWEEIEKLKNLGVPVLASGDLHEAGDGVACLERTGATGVMYARGALRNPAIFKNHLALLSTTPGGQPSTPNPRELILRHATLAREFGAPRAFVRLRSLAPRYARGFPGVGELRQALCLCHNWEDLFITLDRFLSP